MYFTGITMFQEALMSYSYCDHALNDYTSTLIRYHSKFVHWKRLEDSLCIHFTFLTFSKYSINVQGFLLHFKLPSFESVLSRVRLTTGRRISRSSFSEYHNFRLYTLLDKIPALTFAPASLLEAPCGVQSWESYRVIPDLRWILDSRVHTEDLKALSPSPV